MLYAFQFIVTLLVIILAQLIFFPLGALLYIFSATVAALLGASTLGVWLLLNSVIAGLFLLSYPSNGDSTSEGKGFLSL